MKKNLLYCGIAFAFVLIFLGGYYLLFKGMAGPGKAGRAREKELTSWMNKYLTLLGFPVYDGLRSDPRFQAIVAEQKAVYEENLKKYKL